MASLIDQGGDDLDLRIQGLAQELQDMILDFTMSANLELRFSYNPATPRIVRISRWYKSPLGLQVNHRTREAFAKFYFSHFIFRQDSLWTCEHWLPKLDEVHRGLIKTILVDYFTLSAHRTTNGFEFGGLTYNDLVEDGLCGTRGAALDSTDKSVYVFRAVVWVNGVRTGEMLRGDGTLYVED